MTTLSFNDHELVISIVGLDKLLAFRGEVRIELSHIQSVEAYHEGLMDFKVATFGIGTIFAGRVQTGTFKEAGEKSFWDVHDVDKTILLTLKDDKYSKVVIEVEDPSEAVKSIRVKIA